MNVTFFAKIPDGLMNAPGNIVNPVNEMKIFLTGKENEIRKAINGNEPAEFTAITTGGIECHLLITDLELQPGEATTTAEDQIIKRDRKRIIQNQGT